MPQVVASVEDVNHVNEKVDAVSARVDALAAQPKGPTTAPWVGIYVGNQSGTNDFQSLFDSAYMDLGHLSYVRCFDSSIKTPSKARFHAFKGVRVHYSLKPNNRANFIAGLEKAAYQAVVSALPAGSRLSVHHEPENDMDGATFLALTRRAYEDLKEVRPDVEFVYTSMAYQWGTNSKGNLTDLAPWLEAARLVDSVSTDVYAPPSDYRPMAEDDGFQAWMQRLVVPSGKPWGVTERGIDSHNGESARMAVLLKDIQYVLNSDCDYFYYWNADWQSNSASHGWALKGSNEKALFRLLSAQGRCR